MQPLLRMSSKLEDFDVLEFIGKGTFASCYKIRNIHTSEVLVWKVIEYGDLPEDKKQLLVTEVSLLRDLRHPHIVSYYDRIVCKESKRLYIIIEFCPGGDLATLIRTCQRSQSFVEENFIWRVLHQLSSALHACHSWLASSVVLHRDIKPANVFLDDRGSVKLGDFGLACKLEAGQIGCFETMVGTPFYMSPEVVKGEIYNSKSDVWSLGCLVYELCALVPPFNALNMKELSSKIRKGRFPRIPSHYSESLQKVLSSLLVVNQEHRPSIFDVVCHPVILSHLHQNNESTLCLLDSPLQKESSSKNPPPSPADCNPEKITKDTFRGEWMTRLQNLRDREAALRCREQQIDEREHAVLKREHRVALMERMVRDKLVLAEVYLKRSRDTRGPVGGVRQLRPQMSEELDESFSADAGDTSIMPTSTLLDPGQLPKPASLYRAPPPLPPRRVHFGDQNNQNPQPNASGPPCRPKPLCLKVAEAIRSNKSKVSSQGQSGMQQKVLHFPGYTGPAITISVPSSEIEDVYSSNPAVFDTHLQSSPSVKLTVLFDDREDLKKAAKNNLSVNGLDALNLETHFKVNDNCFKNGVDTVATNTAIGILKPLNDTHLNARKIGSSIDSLLDASTSKEVATKFDRIGSICRETVAPTENIFKKNPFGGSLRYQRRSVRSSTSFPGSRFAGENPSHEMDNIKSGALAAQQSDYQKRPDSRMSKKMSTLYTHGKENVPARGVPVQKHFSHNLGGGSVSASHSQKQTVLLR